MPSAARSAGIRGNRLAGRQLGVDPVDHRLLGHPADPEADGLVGVVPRRGPVGVGPGGELVEQLGVGAVEQRRGRLAVEVRRPGVGAPAAPHGLDLVQVGRRDVPHADRRPSTPDRSGPSRPGRRPRRGVAGSRRRGKPGRRRVPWTQPTRPVRQPPPTRSISGAPAGGDRRDPGRRPPRPADGDRRGPRTEPGQTRSTAPMPAADGTTWSRTRGRRRTRSRLSLRRSCQTSATIAAASEITPPSQMLVPAPKCSRHPADQRRADRVGAQEDQHPQRHHPAPEGGVGAELDPLVGACAKKIMKNPVGTSSDHHQPVRRARSRPAISNTPNAIAAPRHHVDRRAGRRRALPASAPPSAPTASARGEQAERRRRRCGNRSWPARRG